MIDKAILPVAPEGIPNELKALRQWVIWRGEQRKEKLIKVPYQVNGQRAKSDSPETWASFDEAFAAYEAGRADGVGFVFAHGGGLTGVDLDHCFDDAGVLDPKAAEVVKALDSYTELSVSGKGLHVIVRASLDTGKRHGPLEIYPHGRYFTMTGRRYGEAAGIGERQDVINRLVQAMSPASQRRNRAAIPTGGGAYLDNAGLIEKARAAKNGAKFSSLWAGDISGYASQSEADLALMCLLLFWTHGDADRAEVLFSQSALAERAKWDRADYRRRTIRSAFECLNGKGAAV